jgi:hypothetical protein
MAYWASMAQFLKSAKSNFHIKRSNKDHWHWFAIGRAGFGISATISSDKERAGVELYIDHAAAKIAFHQLEAQKAVIEQEFGERLEWQELPDRKASRIVVYKHGVDPFDEMQYAELHSWMLLKMDKFRAVFAGRIKALSLDNAPTGENDDE